MDTGKFISCARRQGWPTENIDRPNRGQLMKPSERIDRTYELKRTTVEILLDDRPVQAPATVSLELSPRPQLILGCEFLWKDAAATNELQLKRNVSVRLDNGRTIDMIVGNRWHLGGGKIGNILMPKSEPVTVRDDGVALARCKFALLNFPSIWGAKDIHRFPDPADSTRGFIYQRFQLAAEPWFINIIAVDGVMAVHYHLTRRGGSAITHIGSVTRTDGQEFHRNDLEDLLTGQHLFLSFARGSYCGLALVSGHDANRERVWEQWGTYKVEPWRRELLTWANGMSSDALSSVFEGIWKLLNDPKEGRTVSQVIHWYLRSNESSEPEVSIMLTHAALERLSFRALQQRQAGQKEGDWIAQALKNHGIDPSVPIYCRELKHLQRRYNWQHGPHALVDIRNNLVHPDNRKGPFSAAALLEAQRLGLYYIELMLLSLSGYQGGFLNRLRSEEAHQSQAETVPWTNSPP